MELKVHALKIQVYYWWSKCQLLSRKVASAAETMGDSNEMENNEYVAKPHYSVY